ncbi:MAG TPA: beta-galactosidase, partial [Candidatus Atribacteria bacterium]|nr:beta-galactosidase [Candidatus Atribacteria bacterium]
IQAKNLPFAAELTILGQENPQRDVIHILFYVPERRGKIDIVEDVFPLHNVVLKYKALGKPARVYLAPQKESVDFSFEKGYVNMNVKEILGHQMVVIEY